MKQRGQGLGLALEAVDDLLSMKIGFAFDIFVGARLKQCEAVSAAAAVTAVTAVAIPASTRARYAM